MGWKPELSASRLLQITGASLFAGLCALGADYLFFQSSALMPLLGGVDFPRSAAVQLAHFSTQLAAFVGGLLLYAYAFKTADIQELIQDFVFKKRSIL